MKKAVKKAAPAKKAPAKKAPAKAVKKVAAKAPVKKAPAKQVASPPKLPAAAGGLVAQALGDKAVHRQEAGSQIISAQTIEALPFVLVSFTAKSATTMQVISRSVIVTANPPASDGRSRGPLPA